MRVLMSEALSFVTDVRVGSHHYAAQLMGDGHRVFWLAHAHHALSVARGLLGCPGYRELASHWLAGPERIGHGSWAYHPVTLLPFRDLPLLRTSAALAASTRLTIPPLRTVIARHGFEAPDLLWLSQSPASATMLRFRAMRVVYRMSDRWLSFSHTPASLRRSEERILQRADVIFVTARGLLDELPRAARGKAAYLPNGVDYGHFHDPTATEPPDLACAPRPRALYAGTLGDWVDLPLLVQAARALPHVSFVLVGPGSRRELATGVPPNLHLLGPRPYGQMPRYMRFCDVGLIPFAATPLTHAVNPVKLFEYFAAGLPVVSTRLDEIERVGSPALLASSPADLAPRIREALALGRDLPEYDDFARGNTWQMRYRTALEVIG